MDGNKNEKRRTFQNQSAMRKTSSKGTPPFEVDADRVEWLLKTLVLIPARVKMVLIKRAIEQDLTGLCGL